MSDLLCPFSAPLIKNDFSCSKAKQIIRRGGAEIACENMEMHTSCTSLHNIIKTAALQAMGQDDDLLTLPHNILVKIQYGSLLGLKNIIEATAADNHIEDIVSLVAAAIDKYKTVDQIPISPLTETIMNYKVQRRRKK